MQLLVNIDVPDLRRAEAFYCQAFGLTPNRRIGDHALELLGAAVPIFLLENAEKSRAVPSTGLTRSYARHWCPVHLDIVVDDAEAALARAVAAGATQELPLQLNSWGKLVLLCDPFGNGFCIVEFVGRGYDEIATPV